MNAVKLTGARKNRPAWAANRDTLALHLLGRQVMRRLQIARLYWIENRTAREIAQELETTIGAIEQSIFRTSKIRRRKRKESQSIVETL